MLNRAAVRMNILLIRDCFIRLETVVREGFVGFSHTMHVFTFLIAAPLPSAASSNSPARRKAIVFQNA